MTHSRIGSRVSPAPPTGWAAGVLALAVAAGGIVFSIAPRAVAQESTIGAARAQVQRAPASAAAGLALGRALRRAGHEAESLAELRRVAPVARGVLAIEVGWEIARTLVAQRDFRGTMSACAALAKLPGGLPASHACAAEGHLLWRRGTEALGEIAEVKKLPAVEPEVLYAVDLAEGRAYELASRDADAETAYRAALGRAPGRDGAYVLLGALLARTGRDGTAELRKAVSLDPLDPVDLHELGRVLVASPTTRAEGITFLEKAVAERPAHVDSLRALGGAYLAEGRLGDARRAYAGVLRLAPGDAAAHVAAGRIALSLDDVDGALAAAKKALALLPNEANAELLLADGWARKGEVDLALEAYQKASGLDPENPAPLVRATEVCLRAGRLTSAKAFGQRAVLEFPAEAPAWIAEGDALAADGDAKAARKAYESARKAKNADVPAIDAKLARLR